MDVNESGSADHEPARFLTAWFGVRQVIQAANFNHFQKAGLSATQFMTLNLLPAEDGSITIGELGRKMNLKAATVAKTVDSLEARQLVTRTRSTSDGRVVLVSITKAGQTLQNAAAGQFRAHILRIFSSMPSKDRSALISGLESLVRVAGSLAAPKVGSATPEGRAAPRKSRNSPQSPGH